jgi:hypothetical protein
MADWFSLPRIQVEEQGLSATLPAAAFFLHRSKALLVCPRVENTVIIAGHSSRSRRLGRVVPDPDCIPRPHLDLRAIEAAKDQT